MESLVISHEAAATRLQIHLLAKLPSRGLSGPGS